MKLYGRIIKYIAIIIMLGAIASLMLPICTIQSGNFSATIDGIQLIKDGPSYLMNNKEVQKQIVIIVIALLPVVFCALSAVLTLFARGSKTMILPTVLIALAFFELALFFIGFFQFRSLFSNKVSITLLNGIYVFSALCGLAFLLLLFGWIIGGFNRPNRYYEKKIKRVKDKKRKRARPRRRRKTEKRSRSIREMKPNKEAAQNKIEENKEIVNKLEKKGVITGSKGLYDGITLDLKTAENGSVTLGTTKEAMNAIVAGSMKELGQIVGANCVVSYYPQEECYRIARHSVETIYVKTKEGKMIQLEDGIPVNVTGGAFLYIGDTANCIKLN